MSKIALIVVTQIISLTSLAKFFFSLDPANRQGWPWALFGAAVLAVLVNLTFEMVEHIRNPPRTYSSPKKINNYMCRWVNSGGRVVIFSRDMSWAHEDKVRRVLFGKAGKGELTVLLEKPIPLSEELRAAGANVITYENMNHVPRSRFTIIDFERDGARVAVGVSNGKKHVIQEFRSGHHPFFAVAEDLVKFLMEAPR